VKVKQKTVLRLPIVSQKNQNKLHLYHFRTCHAAIFEK
jgi:hypothetical protein